MKYLVLIAVLVLVYLLWRHQRAQEDDAPAAPPRPGPPALPQDMVRCPVCAVHLPREEAVADAQGRLYCSPAHRRLGDR